MSRGYTPRHAQTAGDLSFAVQFNAETLWQAQGAGGKMLNIYILLFVLLFSNYICTHHVPMSLRINNTIPIEHSLPCICITDIKVNDGRKSAILNLIVKFRPYCSLKSHICFIVMV